MLPAKSKPKMRDVSIYVAEETLARVLALAKREGVRSRNALLTSFIEFSVALFPLLKPMSGLIEQLMEAERCSYAEAVARLVERGLRARGKGEK